MPDNPFCFVYGFHCRIVYRMELELARDKLQLATDEQSAYDGLL